MEGEGKVCLYREKRMFTARRVLYVVQKGVFHIEP